MRFGRNVLDMGRATSHAHILFLAGDTLAPSFGPKRVLAASHPSDFYNFQ